MNYCIVGYGKSNQSILKYLLNKNKNIFVSQNKPFDIETKRFFDNNNILYEENHGSLIEKADLAIVSPGIHPDSISANIIFKNHIKYTTEIEFAYEEIKKVNNKAFFIGITGTNGKTTTTSLIGDIIKEKFPKTFVGGNIGVPLIDADFYNDFFVIEISSFQLFWGKKIIPNISVLLNLAPDHLNWHKSIEDYYSEKISMVKRTNVNKGISIVNDSILIELDNFTNYIEFNKSFIFDNFFHYKNNKIKIKNPLLLLDIYKENTIASIITCLTLDIDKEIIENKLEHFKLLEHRLEFANEIHGIKFLNDSKATNAHAAYNAYKSFRKENYIAFLSGIPKKENMKELINELMDYSKKVFIFGEMINEIKKYDLNEKFIFTQNLEKALEYSLEEAKEGYYIIFSPAGASFDFFNNYIERGLHFKNLVSNYKKEVM